MSADGTVGVEQLLATARAGLARLEPEAAHAESAQGALIVDIRGDGQIAGFQAWRTGGLPVAATARK